MYPHYLKPNRNEITEEVGNYKLNQRSNFMNSGLFKLSWLEVVHALVFGVVTGLVAMAGYILKLGTFFGIDVHTLVNVGGLAALAAVIGLVVPFLTTSQGNFVGIVSVKKGY